MINSIKQQGTVAISYPHLWISILFLCPLIGFTQKDCTNRQILCDTIETIELAPGAGTDASEADNTCITQESASHWIQLDFTEGGVFLFDIIPLDSMADIDFVVYSWDGTSCASRQVIRCMASGSQVVNGMLTSECLGPTGLREGETDVLESAGCSADDNNYLAPIEVSEGSSYLLLINHFGSDTTSIELQTGGTAMIDCLTSTDDTANSKLRRSPFRVVYQGPEIVLEFNDIHTGNAIYITNVSGQVLNELQLGTETYYPITGLPSSGMYLITMVSGKEVFTERIYFDASY